MCCGKAVSLGDGGRVCEGRDKAGIYLRKSRKWRLVLYAFVSVVLTVKKEMIRTVRFILWLELRFILVFGDVLVSSLLLQRWWVLRFLFSSLI